MTPYYADEWCTLYLGDCLEVMSHLDSEPRYDAVITDPPYMIGSLSAGTLTSKTGTWADMMNAALWFTAWYSRAWGLLRNDGSLWSFMNWRTLPVCMKAATDAQFAFTSVMVWDKEWIGPGGHQGLRPSYELVALAAKPDFAVKDRGLADVVRHKTGSYKRTGHPAEKPEALLSKIIGFCSLPPQARVLDPFCGSGTTGVAAKQLGLRSTLIEADERNCEMAAKRLQQGVLI